MDIFFNTETEKTVKMINVYPRFCKNYFDKSSKYFRYLVLCSFYMKKSGDKAEILAIEYLKKSGYKLLETNFRFSIFGEINLICLDRDLTVFIEVKYRSSNKFGTGEESITRSKLSKLKKAIEYRCIKHNLDFEKIRFDVISITKGSKGYRLIHYKNQKLF